MSRLAALALVPAALFASVAHAGPLAQTAQGVANKQETSSSSSSSDSDSDDSAHDSYDSDDTPLFLGAGASATSSAPLHLSGPTRGGVDLLLQSVHDSDGAARAAFFLGGEWLGFGVLGDSYIEKIARKGERDTVRVSFWSALVTLRPVHARGVTVELWGGAGGVTSTHFASMGGAVFGGLFGLALGPAELEARGRYFRFEHDVRARETVIGVRASNLWLGYRALRFDDAPYLHGPEAGLSLRF